MTSEEYAEMVGRRITEARDARALYEDDHALAYAYTELADGAMRRCLGVGRTMYEVRPDRQGFENGSASDALVECRQEALDLPAYLAQVAYHMDLDADPDIREGIEHAAHIILLLDRLAARLADGS